MSIERGDILFQQSLEPGVEVLGVIAFLVDEEALQKFLNYLVLTTRFTLVEASWRYSRSSYVV